MLKTVPPGPANPVISKSVTVINKIPITVSDPIINAPVAIRIP